MSRSLAFRFFFFHFQSLECSERHLCTQTLPPLFSFARARAHAHVAVSLFMKRRPQGTLCCSFTSFSSTYPLQLLYSLSFFARSSSSVFLSGEVSLLWESLNKERNIPYSGYKLLARSGHRPQIISEGDGERNYLWNIR